MNMDPMDDDVGDVLDRQATAVGYVNVDATTIYGFEAVHDQFLLQGYHHVAFEYDPEWLVLDHGVTEGSRYGVNRIVVSRVGYDVVTAVATADCVAAETY